MSTRQESETQHEGPSRRTIHRCRLGPLDPAEAIALVARSRRERLLAIYRHRLPREDLEDCYSQATLELLTRAGNRDAFSSNAHIANALAQRLQSRVHDRRRALSGRSPIETAIAGALSIPSCEALGVQIADTCADVECLVMQREDLRRLARVSRELSEDQRLVLANDLQGLGIDEFCLTHGWTAAKYRKVAQRARTRLGRLVEDGSTWPPRHGMRNQGVTARAPRRIKEQGPTYGNHSPNT